MATTELDKQELLGIGFNYSLGESAGGIALIVLAILALAKVDPMLLNGIAVIVAGIALLIEDGSVNAKRRALPYMSVRDMEAANPDGVGPGALVGISGVVLGILAILGIAAAVLTAIAIVIFGAAVLFDLATSAQNVAVRRMNGEGSAQSVRITRAAASSGSTSAILIAVALITLGILALAGLTSSILVTVGLLGLGAYLFIKNAAVAGSLLGAAS